MSAATIFHVARERDSASASHCTWAGPMNAVSGPGEACRFGLFAPR